MDEPKVFGIYPGNLNKKILENINTIQEEELWQLIYCVESEIFWIAHEDRNYDEDLLELEEKQYALEYLIYNTKRFGVTFKEPSEEKHLERSESYIMWYKFWNTKNLNKTQKVKIKR